MRNCATTVGAVDGHLVFGVGFTRLFGRRVDEGQSRGILWLQKECLVDKEWNNL